MYGMPKVTLAHLCVGYAVSLRISVLDEFPVMH